MNMQQILNDPELSKELDKAYALAAPYRAKVQYKLSIFEKSIFFDDYVCLLDDANGDVIQLINISPDDERPYINPMLKV